MAKRRKTKSRAKRKFTLPIAVVAGFTPGLFYTSTWVRDLGVTAGLSAASRIYTGYDVGSGTWNWQHMRLGTMPILLGMVIHKVASMMGVNRALGRAGVPFIRI